MKASSAIHRFVGKVLSLTMSMKHDSSNISFHVRSNRESRRLVARFFVEGQMSLQKRVRLSSEWRSILRGRGKGRLSMEVCVFVNVLSLHVIYCTNCLLCN